MKEHRKQPVFKIYYAPTGFGLVKDAEILNNVICELGFKCQIEKTVNSQFQSSSIYKQFLYFLKQYNCLAIFKKITKKILPQSNVYSLHLENIVFTKCFLNENHILIPNQEWFDPHSIDLLRFMTAIWCKSHFAVNIFKELNSKTELIGFSSHIDEKAKKYR